MIIKVGSLLMLKNPKSLNDFYKVLGFPMKSNQLKNYIKVCSFYTNKKVFYVNRSNCILLDPDVFKRIAIREREWTNSLQRDVIEC